MKDVALVFYGQPRYIDNLYLIDQWKKIISGTDLSIDVYGHFWSSTSNTSISKTYEEFVTEKNVDAAQIEDSLKSCIDFKKIIVEDSLILDSICEQHFSKNRFIKRRVDLTNPSTGRATLGQWYSTEKGINLARDNGEYKVIIRVRWDIIFETDELTKVVDFLTQEFLKTDHGLTMEQVGILDMVVLNGQPIINDWITTVPKSCFDFFSKNLVSDIATMINSIFSTVELPSSVQEHAFYRFLQINQIDTKKIHINCRIHRENDDPSQWRWPNFSV